ncbi:MAG: ATP-binding protein, partial [Pseudomonadota bacterium]
QLGSSAQYDRFDALMTALKGDADMPPTRLRRRKRMSTALLIIDELGYLPITPGAANLFLQLVNAREEKGAMILTSNRGFAEWGEVLGDIVFVQIEGASYRLRGHADLIPEHVRSNAPIAPPPTPKRRGRPPKNGSSDPCAG